MRWDIRTQHRRMSGPAAFPVFVTASFGGAVGAPVPGLDPTVSLGALVPRRKNSFCLVFSNGINNVSSYAGSQAPAGFSLVAAQGATSNPSVFSKGSIDSSIQVDVPWGVGADIWNIQAIAALFAVSNGVHNLIQQQGGGATLIAGNNARTLASPTTQGNTGIACVLMSGHGGGGTAQALSVSDDAGNEYGLVCSVTTTSPPLELDNSTQMYLFVCRSLKGGGVNMNISCSGDIASGSPYIAEFQFH